ncbi:DUF1080 domain-containing protein [Rubripirellula amarantea]|nr:DUF1080 domain-containing protein [Rubripirellula amarantea]
MNRICCLAALTLVFVTSWVNAPAGAESPSPTFLVTGEPVPEWFTPIFDGQTLSGWIARPHMDPSELAAMDEQARADQESEWMTDAMTHWVVQDDELVNDGAGPYLVSEANYGDYELIVDYQTVSRADSGIYLKGCPQVQIWDYTDPAKFEIGSNLGSGGLWNNSAGAPGKDPFVLADKPFGETNRFFIRQIGSRTTVYLNGKLVVDNAIMENYWDRESPLPPTGPIILQTHGGEIRWSNLAVHELTPEEANTFLDAREKDSFTSIFNGEDLDGWQGETDSYEVKDGAIRCKKGEGGNLLTQKEYANFVARVEFRLPVAGNNGLAIRSPLGGDAAYQAMCEIQTLDTSHPNYEGLDPRQAHGSAYGMVAARQGYLREPGVWNFQEVTVNGSRVSVELNGNTILDADLAEVTEYLDNKEHPGKNRTSGFFGFAGHNDAVEYRNISIKELP